ncbi:general substrate transporter [Aspergillus pseudoustus]|uniref:General substrate transporter n=1 Tax=Aspergillus pseudoustus TaxID=1810923 RepID=A0ABR4INZ0_9EURO
MDGYDMSLLTSFFTFPVFQRSYGSTEGDEQGRYYISSVWQAALVNGTQAGVIIGLLGNGVVAGRFGYRRTLISALLVLGAFVFLAVFATNLETLLAAQILCGIPWGVFQTLSVSYAAEVMPVALRGQFLSYINLCWVLGQTCGVGVIRALVDTDSEWAYRLPFALQSTFIAVILTGVVFAPESPWWLIRQDRPDDARKSLLRLTSKGAGALGIEEIVAMMKHTNEVEKYYGKNNGKMTYLNCFRGVDRRRTEITTMVWVMQQVCGSTLTFYAIPLYAQAGFQARDAFNLAVGMYGVSICGNVVCWFLLQWVGRRRLFLTGTSLSLAILTCGCVSLMPETAAQSWTLGSLIIVLTAVYQATLGPVGYMLVAEIPSTRLRVKTVVVGRVVFNITSIITNILAARMLSPSAWNWKGKSCFFFVGTTVLCLLWCYFRLPEPYGLSYLEIDILFAKHAKASKFRVFQRNLERSGYNEIASCERGAGAWQRY